MSVVLEAGTAIYVALAVALSVWLGIFAYLWRLDAQARDLRRRLDSQPAYEPAPLPNAILTRTQGHELRVKELQGNMTKEQTNKEAKEQTT